jgi:hypothetical protein
VRKLDIGAAAVTPSALVKSLHPRAQAHDETVMEIAQGRFSLLRLDAKGKLAKALNMSPQHRFYRSPIDADLR